MSAQKVLFVADRPEISQQPVLRLRLEGYAVDEAHSREEAAESLTAASYDLIILDAELPGMDGWQVLQELNDHPNFGEAKLIVLMASQGETGRLALVPVDAELRRPFTMADLMAAVDRLLA